MRAHVLVATVAAGLAFPASGWSQSPGGEEVTFLEGGAVAAAFAAGRPLLETAAYKVHASRRDAPGAAEIHVRDTDIVYVLDGTAVLVTGGSVPDGSVTAPEEVRGSAIRGGVDRPLAPGDVIVVPRGVPHWFREVEAPFVYYVVKVTEGATP